MTETAQKDYKYRVRYKQVGMHLHCRVFSRLKGQFTWAKCGDLVVRAEEWVSFQSAFAGAEFIEEEF